MIKNINHVFTFIYPLVSFLKGQIEMNICLEQAKVLPLHFYRNFVEAEISVVKMAQAECRRRLPPVPPPLGPKETVRGNFSHR